jgi:pyruvate kinase
MLAGETAIGAHPVRAVDALDRIIRDAELLRPAGRASVPNMTPLPPHGRAICEAALTLAERARASAIIAITRGGKTARALSALRPETPIVAVTDDERVARRLTLSWGVLPIVGDLSGDADAIAVRLDRQLVQRRVIREESMVVLVSVTPDPAPGPSNFVKLHRVAG